MRRRVNFYALLFLAGIASEAFTAAKPGGKASPQQAAEKEPPESTQRMGRLLRHLADEIDITQVPVVVNGRKADSIRLMLANAQDWKAEWNLEFALAEELLCDGQNAECIAYLDRLERVATFTLPIST